MGLQMFGIPFASVSRWCLERAVPRSVGCGPVAGARFCGQARRGKPGGRPVELKYPGTSWYRVGTGYMVTGTWYQVPNTLYPVPTLYLPCTYPVPTLYRSGRSD